MKLSYDPNDQHLIDLIDSIFENSDKGRDQE